MNLEAVLYVVESLTLELYEQVDESGLIKESQEPVVQVFKAIFHFDE